MSVKNKITFQKIDPLHSSLELVIEDSIGFSTPEKITQVLKSYQLPNHFLMAAFLSENLIGVIGYMLNNKKVTIQHISVLEGFRKQGIGEGLIQALVQDCAPNKILLETDGQSVGFYKKLGFVCEPFEGKHRSRYHCYLDLVSSFYKLKEKLDRKIESVLPEFTEMHGEIAVACGDNILYHKNFSYPDAPWEVERNSQYLIGSITKQFTAAALLKSLYDKQMTLNTHVDIEIIKMLVKNDLQKPISQFLPLEHSTWQGHMPDWATVVTVHQLLTHTSGIQKKNEVDFEDHIESTPGKQFSYSNPNYILLGKIISTITNTPLDAYYKSVLFDPASMENTYLPFVGTPKDLKHQAKFRKLALGFEYNLVPLEIAFTSAKENISFDQLNVAGGIISTIEDCIRWNNALYQGKIIPKFLVELMVDRYILSLPFPTYYDLDQVWYGYGLDVYQADRKICYQHPGGLPGYQGRLIYMPVSEITIVHLSNSQKDGTEYSRHINNIRNEMGCDKATAETVFDERFPYYKSRLEKRMNIFRFANKLRDIFFDTW